jgi:hypothetical protein
MADKTEPISRHKKLENKIDTQADTNDSWNIGRIFWGFLFVIIGGLVLASNFGMVKLHFENIWLLWPLLIISAGISMLAVRSVAWRIVSILFAIFSLVTILWVLLGSFLVTVPVSTYVATVQKISDKVEQVEVSVKAGASILRIGTTSQEAVMKAELESNTSVLSKASNLVGSTQQIDLKMETNGNGRWFVGGISNKWNIDLNRNLPLALIVDSGASNIDIDMSMAMLRSIDIKTGVSDLALKLGDIEKVVDVNIESGVSSILIKIPTIVGVRLKTENGLTSNDLADLVKIDDKTFESTDYNQSKYRINITSKIGLSSFTIRRY